VGGSGVSESERSHLKIAFKSSISIQSRRCSLLHLPLSLKTPRSLRLAHVFFLEHPRMPLNVVNKGGVDGWTRETRIKAGRSRKTTAQKK
jgi:hypothetical protein